VRFRIVKEGWDRAVIAQLRVQTADQQSCAVDAIELEPIGDLAPPPPDDTGI
jgi:hypothetical protein